MVAKEDSKGFRKYEIVCFFFRISLFSAPPLNGANLDMHFPSLGTSHNMTNIHL